MFRYFPVKIRYILFAATMLAMSGVSPAQAEEATLTVEQGMGPSPVLPDPVKSMLPTMNIAPAKKWQNGAQPVAAPGLKVQNFAGDLQHPRWVYVLPNGDVLVAQTDAPAKPDDAKGIKGFIMKKTMKKAGSGAEENPNNIILLRDEDGDGVADKKTVFIGGLNSPFGMALIGDTFYVADTDAIMAFPYHEGDIQITAKGTKLADLPAGTINHHWTKNIIASQDGSKLYATVGSNSNVAENGLAAEDNRAAIFEIDAKTGAMRMFASGLRNANGMGWEPQTGALWTVVNERDELGSDLVPDYMTSVKDGGFYGWPFSYYGQHVDTRVKDQNPDMVAKAIVPDYALGPHTASLSLTFYTADLMPQYKGGVFVGQHGSWNRKPHSGYKVIFIPFSGGKPAENSQDVLTGFLDKDENAQGRPVGVAVDKQGALLVADDVGDKIWRVSPQ